MTAPLLSPRADDRVRTLVQEIAATFRAKRIARGDRQLDVAQYLGLRENEICLFETQPSRFMTIAKAVRALNIYGLTLAVVPISTVRNRE